MQELKVLNIHLDMKTYRILTEFKKSKDLTWKDLLVYNMGEM